MKYSIQREFTYENALTVCCYDNIGEQNEDIALGDNAK